MDDNETHLGMIGRQWVLRNPTHDDELLRSYISFLCETTGMKVRYKQVEALAARSLIKAVEEEGETPTRSRK